MIIEVLKNCQLRGCKEITFTAPKNRVRAKKVIFLRIGVNKGEKMREEHKKIHRDFLKTLPDGMKLVYHGGKDFLVVEKVFCPNGHTLIAPNVKIRDFPAIKIKVNIGKSEGLLFLDAFWGSHAKLYNFIPVSSEREKIVKSFCPECGVSLDADEKCILKECNCKKAIVLHLPAENRIMVCSKLGCPGHDIDIKTLPQRLSKSISKINYFGEGLDDDFFMGV